MRGSNGYPLREFDGPSTSGSRLQITMRGNEVGVGQSAPHVMVAAATSVLS